MEGAGFRYLSCVARDRIGKTCCRGFVSANGAGLLTHAEVTQVG